MRPERNTNVLPSPLGESAQRAIAALEDSARAYERAGVQMYTQQLGFSDLELAGQMSLTDEADERETGGE